MKTEKNSVTELSNEEMKSIFGGEQYKYEYYVDANGQLQVRIIRIA